MRKTKIVEEFFLHRDYRMFEKAACKFHKWIDLVGKNGHIDLGGKEIKLDLELNDDSDL